MKPNSMKVSIIYKSHLSSDIIQEVANELSFQNIEIATGQEEGGYHNFTGPELYAIVTYITEHSTELAIGNVFGPAVYDVLKTGFKTLWKKLIPGKLELSREKISIRVETANKKKVELNFEGNFNQETIDNIIEKAFECLKPEEREKVFSGDQKYVYQEGGIWNPTPLIRFIYNDIEQKWKPYDFTDIKKWEEEMRRKMNDLSS